MSRSLRGAEFAATKRLPRYVENIKAAATLLVGNLQEWQRQATQRRATLPTLLSPTVELSQWHLGRKLTLLRNLRILTTPSPKGVSTAAIAMSKGGPSPAWPALPFLEVPRGGSPQP